MDFREALDAIENGARVRRDGWHKGRRWIARQDKDGFAEYVMAHTQDDNTIEWPLAMGRADWCATDWVLVDDNGADLSAPPAPATPESPDTSGTPKTVPVARRPRAPLDMPSSHEPARLRDRNPPHPMWPMDPGRHVSGNCTA